MERLKITHVMLGVETTERALPFIAISLDYRFNEISGFAFLDAGLFTLALSRRIGARSAVRVGATELVFGVGGRDRHLPMSCAKKGVELIAH